MGSQGPGGALGAGNAQADVEISPSELKFRFALNKQMLSTIHIANNSDNRIGFKIKTTAPKKYVVRPSSGIADAKSSVSVQVIMQAQKEQPLDLSCKDKFMVQTVIVGEGEELDKDTFNKDVKKEALREARLRVTLEGPAAPPSPVPEASEHDEEVSRGALPNNSTAYSGGRGLGTTDQLAESMPTSGQEVSALRAALNKTAGERDDLRRALESLQQQQRTASSRAVSRRGITILHVIIVAILAFLLGHFT